MRRWQDAAFYVLPVLWCAYQAAAAILPVTEKTDAS
jgi:hypothetical protein